jgi:hypothetical protein
MKRLDTLFPYPTPKIARIKDSKLGLLRYALMCIILVYVVGYQIMWRGNHLETQDLAGVYQLQLDHPTKNACNPQNAECMQNFTSLSELAYCSQSPEAASIKLPCQYWDAQQLAQLTDQGLMIPTHVSTFYQTAGCKPTVANNWTCVGWLYDFLDKKGHLQSKRGQASPIEDIFIADSERYTLMIDHSVRSTLGHRYYASDMVGYLLDCNQEHQSDAACVPRPIECDNDDCKGKPHTLPQTRTLESHPKFRGDRRSLSLAVAKAEVGERKPMVSQKESTGDLKEISLHSKVELSPGDMSSPEQPVERDVAEHEVAVDILPNKEEDLLERPPASASKPDLEPGAPGRTKHLEQLGVASLAQGDIFTIGHLLKAANVSLDKRRHHVPSWVGGSYRSSGFVLVIRIHYSNIESWLGLKVLPWKVTGPTMHYTYRITKHASHDDFMLKQVHPGGPGEPKNSRVVKEFHGIRVLIEQSGSVAVWDNIQLLLILTTTLALLAVSNCITDTVCLYCLPQSDEYWAIKYERPRTGKAMLKRREPDVEEPGQPAGTDEPGQPAGTDDVMHYSSITM